MYCYEMENKKDINEKEDESPLRKRLAIFGEELKKQYISTTKLVNEYKKIIAEEKLLFIQQKFDEIIKCINGEPEEEKKEINKRPRKVRKIEEDDKAIESSEEEMKIVLPKPSILVNKENVENLMKKLNTEIKSEIEIAYKDLVSSKKSIYYSVIT